MQRQWLSVSRRGSYLHGLTCPDRSDRDVGILLMRNLRHLASTRRRSDAEVLKLRSYDMESSRCTAPPEVSAALGALAAGGLLPPAPESNIHQPIDIDVSFVDEALSAVFDCGPTVHVAWLNAMTNPLTMVNPLVCSSTAWRVLTHDLVPRIMYRSESLQYLMRGARGVAAHSKDDLETAEAALAVAKGCQLDVDVAERQIKKMKSFSYVVIQALQAVHLLRAYHEAVRDGTDNEGKFSFKALGDQHRWDVVARRTCDWQHVMPNQRAVLAHSLPELADLRRSRDAVRWVKRFPADRRRALMHALLGIFDEYLVDGAWEGQSSVTACREAVDVWLYELASAF